MIPVAAAPTVSTCGRYANPIHQVKHGTGWTRRTNPTSGGSTWTSPTGHRYDVVPEDHHSATANDETLAVVSCLRS
jgi:hypothetical protein